MERIVTAQSKAAALTEALPYIQDFRGSVVLIKIGGSVMESEESLDGIMDDIAFLNAVGIKVVIVHGGGKAISKAIKASGHEPKFVDGLRVTDEPTMEIVRKTLNNIVNPDIVTRLCARGTNAKPLHGNWIFGARKIMNPDRGYVGEVVRVTERAVVEKRTTARADVLRQEVAVYRDEADYVRARLYGKIAPNLEAVLTADRPDAPFGLPFKDAGPKAQGPGSKPKADGPKAQ